jgi:apolipoprotein N-acyltransferase
MPWDSLPSAAREKFHRLATERQATIVLGAFRQQQQHSFNSAVVIAPGATQPRFVDKHLRFPLSEYLPAGMGWIRRAMQMAARDLDSGPATARPIQSADHAFGIVICYEIGSPSLFGARARDANWMLLISDMSWFPSPNAAQHLRSMARWRAAETGRWLLSVSLPHGSMLVNPQGDIVDTPAPHAQLWRASVPASKATTQ